jgi:hypothetical protein
MGIGRSIFPSFLPAPSKGRAKHDQLAASRSGLDRLATVGMPDPPIYIAVAGGARDRARGLVTEKIEDLRYGEANEVGPAGLRSMGVPVFRKHVCDQDVVGLPVPETRPPLSPNVVGEHFFSRADISLARACADLSTAVEDNPDRVSPSTLSEPKAGAFPWTRHSSLIRSILAKVV